jgi:two-component SAPR family response regulator
MTHSADLQVVALGRFQVWRPGGAEIQPADWGRQKARTLAQYLVTRRRVLTPKERIAFELWPELDAERADRDFKVALNALLKALEPDRAPRAESTFVQRQGTSYGIDPKRLDLDVDRFDELVRRAARSEPADSQTAIRAYRKAIDLYKGDYLPEALYQDWASAERERLLTLYLTSASRLAQLLVPLGREQEAISLAEAVLSRDRCWEEAYRVLMQAHQRRGNRPLAIRAYQRCLEALRDELDLEPMTETTHLYDLIRSG